MKNLMLNSASPRRKQMGAVTLVITMLILVAVALGVYSMVGTTSIESRMSANDKRSRQAMQAAQAGIDYVVAGLSRSVVDRSYLCEDAAVTKQKYGFVLDYGTTLCDQVPFEILTKLDRIRSFGYSPEGDSVKVIESTIDLTSSWAWGLSAASLPAGGGNAAVVTRGNATLGGASQATTCTTLELCKEYSKAGRQEGTLVGDTILAGGTVDAEKHVGHYQENDATLASLSNEALFQKYASGGLDKAAFKQKAYTYTPPDKASGTKDEGINNANTSGNQLIYVPDGLTVQGGTIGSPEKPVVLYIDGNLRATGPFLVWGIVYVKSMDTTKGGPGGNGTVNVMGRFVSEEAIDANGNLAVYYNPDLLVDANAVDPSTLLANQSGKAATVRVGSWRELALPASAAPVTP